MGAAGIPIHRTWNNTVSWDSLRLRLGLEFIWVDGSLRQSSQWEGLPQLLKGRSVGCTLDRRPPPSYAPHPALPGDDVCWAHQGRVHALVQPRSLFSLGVEPVAHAAQAQPRLALSTVLHCSRAAAAAAAAVRLFI